LQEALRNNDISTTKNLSYALKYLKKGFSIIPVKGNFYSNGTNIEDRSKDSKAPLIAWTEYQNRLPTEVEVKSWWTKYPLANIAVITGKVSNLVVVDFDSDEAVRWARENNLLETLCVETARGLHAYYRYPQNRTIQNTVNLNNMKIDIRADGGYVIAPPSIHITGMEYTFTIKKPIASLPEIFLSKSKKVIDLKSFYNGVKEGSRNDTLARLCGSWVNDNLSLEECLEMAYLWNERNNPPLGVKEVERTVKSIYKKHLLGSTKNSTYYHEKNLLRLPIFTYSKEKIHKAEKIEVIFESKNVKRSWTVIPSLVYGLPGPFDEMIFMAINKIISEKPKPINNPVDVGSLKSIAKLIGYDVSGHSLKLIKNSIKRIKSINLLSETIYFDATTKKFITDMFNIIDRVMFQGELDDYNEKIKSTYIWLNSVYLKNINAGYVAEIDYNVYFSLKSFIARGIYKTLTPLFSINNNLPFKISYKKLIQRIQITEKKYLSDIKVQLQQAHKELIEIGIFKKIEYKQSKQNLLILYFR